MPAHELAQGWHMGHGVPACVLALFQWRWILRCQSKMSAYARFMSDDPKEPHQLTLFQKRLVTSAPAMGDESPDDILFQHSVICQTSLPYRRPEDDIREWRRNQGAVSLLIEAGNLYDPEARAFVKCGLPYGPKPRLILAHLNAEALRTGSPEIEVENSLTGFVKKMGFPSCGRTINSIKQQLGLLSAARVTLGISFDGKHGAQVDMKIVRQMDLWLQKDARQRVLWPTTIHLGAEYFESLQKHAVPLHPQALAVLSHSALALDLYSWLAQRLHRVNPRTPQLVAWKTLKDQFGQEYNRIRKFRETFEDALLQVKTQYPAASIDLNDQGLELRHSFPPILSRHSLVPK